MSYFIRFTSKPTDNSGGKDITVGKIYEVLREEYGNEYIIDDAEDVNSNVVDGNESCYVETEKRSHYDLRIAHAKGADIESSVDGGLTWGLNTEPLWREDTLYRIAIPKPPERVFPVTSFTDDELIAVYCSTDCGFSVDAYRAIANAAVRRHIEDTENE